MKTLKFLGGGLIVACAFAIMLPDVITYLSGLWRIILLIVTMVVGAAALVFSYHKLRARLQAKNDEGAE